MGRYNRRQRPLKTGDQIYKWLQDNKVYDLFKSYLERDGKNINTYTKRYNGPFYITLAFLWGSTRQGNKFWYKVSEKFQKWYGKEGDK